MKNGIIKKIISHYQKGTVLSPPEEGYRNTLLKVVELHRKGCSKTEIIKQIKEDGGLPQWKVYQAYEHAWKLFAIIFDISDEAKRAMVGQFYLDLAERAKAKKNLAIEKGAIDSYAKLHGLFKNKSKEEDKTVIRRPKRRYSTDPSVLDIRKE